jgi:hypothetical protein
VSYLVEAGANPAVAAVASSTGDTSHAGWLALHFAIVATKGQGEREEAYRCFGMLHRVKFVGPCKALQLQQETMVCLNAKAQCQAAQGIGAGQTSAVLPLFLPPPCRLQRGYFGPGSARRDAVHSPHS